MALINKYLRLLSFKIDQEICQSKYFNTQRLYSNKCPPSKFEKKLPEPKRLTLETPEDIKKKQLSQCRIVVRQNDDYSIISGIPKDTICTRIARIYQPRKNAAQSGTYHIGHWELDFNNKPRWENALMSWCSSGDPISNQQLKFSTKSEAIEYCKKNRINFYIQEGYTKKKFKVRGYGINFHYKNRTRVETK